MRKINFNSFWCRKAPIDENMDRRLQKRFFSKAIMKILAQASVSKPTGRDRFLQDVEDYNLFCQHLFSNCFCLKREKIRVVEFFFEILAGCVSFLG
jgi:hypothetical protein